MSGISVPDPDGTGGLTAPPPPSPGVSPEGDRAIREKHIALGGVLGPPGTPSLSGAGGGMVRHFSDGSIYWHPSIGAHDVRGGILSRYLRLGAEESFLGYPISDETVTADGAGRVNQFQGGSIYFHPDVGAHEVHGDIGNHWIGLGAETSYFGYPVADEADTGTGRGGRVSRFQNGSIFLGPNGEMLDAPETIVLASTIVTDETIGGSVQLIVNSRGDFAYSGHVHNSGLVGLTVSLVSALHVRGADGRAFVATEPEPPADSFTVSGTIGGGPETRDHDWSRAGTATALRDNWPAIRSSGMTTRVEVGAEVASVIALVVAGLFVVVVPVFLLTGGENELIPCPDGKSFNIHKRGTPPPRCQEEF